VQRGSGEHLSWITYLPTLWQAERAANRLTVTGGHFGWEEDACRTRGGREFIALLGGTAAWPLAARTQSGPVRRIGVPLPLVGLADEQ
jgi:hypothetical protein